MNHVPMELILHKKLLLETLRILQTYKTLNENTNEDTFPEGEDLIKIVIKVPDV